MLNLLPHRHKRAAMGQGAAFGDTARVISSAATRCRIGTKPTRPHRPRALGATGVSPACRVLASDRAGRSATGAQRGLFGAARAPQNPSKSGSSGWRISAAFSDAFGESRPDQNHLVAGRDLRHDPAMTKRVVLYARCSTADRQTIENQIRDLRVVAEQHGWIVAGVFDDDGISGGVPREERPAMQRLLRAIARREIDMVAAWDAA